MSGKALAHRRLMASAIARSNWTVRLLFTVSIIHAGESSPVLTTSCGRELERLSLFQRHGLRHNRAMVNLSNCHRLRRLTFRRR